MKLQDLKTKIINYHSEKNKKIKLVYIGEKNISFNKTIYNTKEFKTTKLYNDIMCNTAFLPNNIEFHYRLKSIFQDIDHIPKCPICNEPLAILNVPHMTAKFFQKTCGKTSCRINMMNNAEKNITLESRKKHKTLAIERKQKVLLSCNEILQSYKDNRYELIELQNLKNELTKKLKALYKNGAIIKDNDCNEKKDMIASILKYTEFIEIPCNINSKKELKLNERLYCILNDKKHKGICKYCGNETKFISAKRGYQESCSNCIGDKFREHIGYPTIEQMKQMIDYNKYEVIQFPKNTENDKLIIKCKKCGYVSEHYIYNGRGKDLATMLLCSNCEKYSSNEEGVCRKLLTDYNISFNINTRSIITPYELDIYVDEKKLAFEFDGLYWHNDNVVKRTYHLMKTKMCKEKGIQLIHIFENEWLNKQDIVKSRLKNLLGIYDQTVFARKCKVKVVDNKISKEFQEANHIQGAVNAKVNLGLYFNDELISLMTFGKCRFNKTCEWELLRFCNKLGYHIPGAASKLLTHFERYYKPKSLISYADRRWSQGKVYEALGFKLDHISAPNYWYLKPSNTQVLYNRVHFQKHKLKNLLENFDPKKSESENMKANGYAKIYDCGNLVFVKTY